MNPLNSIQGAQHGQQTGQLPGQPAPVTNLDARAAAWYNIHRNKGGIGDGTADQGMGLPVAGSFAIFKIKPALAGSKDFDSWYAQVEGAARSHNLQRLLDINCPKPDPNGPTGDNWYNCSLQVRQCFETPMNIGCS